MGKDSSDLWLIVGCIGVLLLLAFCAWSVHFAPDMTQFISESQEAFGTLILCGGPIFLLVAIVLLVIACV